MGASQFVILSLNCRRFERYDKLINIKNYCDLYSPDLICFQEVFVPNYLSIFSEDYEVFANVETNQKIGTALAIRKGIKIMDFAMCNLGRIIGIKLSNIQVWNVYAASGSGNKKSENPFSGKPYQILCQFGKMKLNTSFRQEIIIVHRDMWTVRMLHGRNTMYNKVCWVTWNVMD